MGAQSIAAKSLAQWVIAIEKYALIYKYRLFYQFLYYYTKLYRIYFEICTVFHSELYQIKYFFFFFRIVAPKKQAADDALASLKSKQLLLANAQNTLLGLQNLLSQLEIDFNQKMKEKEQLVKKVKKYSHNINE